MRKALRPYVFESVHSSEAGVATAPRMMTLMGRLEVVPKTFGKTSICMALQMAEVR